MAIALDVAQLAQIDPSVVRRALLDKYQDDPVGYRHKVLRVNSTRQQDEVSLSVRDNKKTMVQAAHGVGKTHLVAGLVQWNYDCFEPSITLTTAPNWNSVVELLWAELSSQRRLSGMPMDDLCAFHGGIGTSLRKSELHYAKGHNAKTGEGFQGRHDERLMIALDEGPGVPAHIWKPVDSMLQSEMCRLVVIGNPTVTSGPYFDARSDPTFNVIRMSALDHPNIAAELLGRPAPLPKAVRLSWVQEMIYKHCVVISSPNADCFEFPPQSGIWYLPNDEFRSRVLGLFPKHASNAVWDETWIDSARERVLPIPETGLPEIGCDVARFGDDLTTIWTRFGPCVLSGERHSQRDTVQVARLCEDKAGELGRRFGVDRRKVRIKVDDSGVGGGVTDTLFHDGFAVCGVNSGERAEDEERYPNTRSELWFRTAERAHDMRLDLSRVDIDSFKALKKELLQPTYKLDGHSRRLVEPKEVTKKRLEHSPDDADGFNLAFAPYEAIENAMIPPVSIDHTSLWSPVGV